MTDQPDNQPLRPDADQGREPRFVPGRSGTRLFSMAALLERIEQAFYDENDESTLREADTSAKRYKLILDTANYVLGVESIQMSSDDKADLLRRLYSYFFGYGPLDALFLDPRVTTISLNGVDHAAVRYGHGDLVNLGTLFDDDAQMRRVIDRLLLDAGAEIRDDTVALETGLKVGDRPASVSVVLPSAAFAYSVDIRLHPVTAPTLDELAADGFMTEDALKLLRALLVSKYGFVIAGETETGKTTLLNALARELPPNGKIVAVERTGELRLAPEIERFIVRWPMSDQAGVTFGDQIFAGLMVEPSCLLLDEVRSDEPHSIAPLLSYEQVPRQIWVVRAAPDHKRLQSALGMLARRSDIGQGEAPVHALYERLPFMVTVARIREHLQLFSVAEWQSRIDTDYPDYVMLMRYQDGRAQLTGNPPARWLD
jgi:type IV secretory pathway ATPase VirB11/archaellum biosynthesis ATPase